MLGVANHAWGYKPCLGLQTMFRVANHAWGCKPCLGLQTMLGYFTGNSTIMHVATLMLGEYSKTRHNYKQINNREHHRKNVSKLFYCSNYKK
jgi:hypothetical protein